MGVLMFIRELFHADDGLIPDLLNFKGSGMPGFGSWVNGKGGVSGGGSHGGGDGASWVGGGIATGGECFSDGRRPTKQASQCSPLVLV